MKNISRYISIILSIASFAIANNLNAESYPYVGFSIGQATIEEACNESSGTPVISCEDSDTSFKVYGGAKLHQNYAFEVSYIDMGESVVKDIENTLIIEAAGLNASVFGIVPASYNVDLFGKVGLMYWDANKSWSGNLDGAVASSNGTDMTFGFGINYGVSRILALRAEFEKFLNVGGELTTGESDVTLITLGVALYF